MPIMIRNGAYTCLSAAEKLLPLILFLLGKVWVKIQMHMLVEEDDLFIRT